MTTSQSKIAKSVDQTLLRLKSCHIPLDRVVVAGHRVLIVHRQTATCDAISIETELMQL